MRGIYIHIPFCRKACRYCDFFFSVSLQYLDDFVDLLVEEIRQKGKPTPTQPLDTLYLGGGTPSVLSADHLSKILDAISKFYVFREDPEWTIECNPDDLSPEHLSNLKEAGFNRLSIGVQSFHEKDLELMRRSHDAGQALESIHLAVAAGFDNITMDLIYGIPGQSAGEWEENIERALMLPLSHISAYHLTFEPGTVFDHWRKKGRLSVVPEEESVKQYRMLRKKLLTAGYDHYELSNFALGGKVSEHNSLYWSGQPYHGFGPSAHSYDGENRSWNISSLKDYMEGIVGGKRINESEHLSNRERYHDYLITSLRTKRGVDLAYLEARFGKDCFRHFEQEARTFLEAGTMIESAGKIAIDPGRWLISDHILRSLFLD